METSPSGNWTLVSRVLLTLTGGDTNHYTNEDNGFSWKFIHHSALGVGVLTICRNYQFAASKKLNQLSALICSPSSAVKIDASWYRIFFFLPHYSNNLVDYLLECKTSRVKSSVEPTSNLYDQISKILKRRRLIVHLSNLNTFTCYFFTYTLLCRMLIYDLLNQDYHFFDTIALRKESGPISDVLQYRANPRWRRCKHCTFTRIQKSV